MPNGRRGERQAEPGSGQDNQQAKPDDQVAHRERRNQEPPHKGRSRQHMAGKAISGKEAQNHGQKGRTQPDKQRVAERANQIVIGKDIPIPSQRWPVERRDRQRSILKGKQHQRADGQVDKPEGGNQIKPWHNADHSRSSFSQRADIR